MRLEGKPLFWKWSAAPGVAAALNKGELEILTPGRVTLAPADGEALLLSGTTPDQGELIMEVGSAAPFKLEFLSYGKSNISVPVNPSETDKAGRRKVRIPLEKFGPFHDLAKFEGVVIVADTPLLVKSIELAGLDKAANIVNLLPDPSFEEAKEPAVNYLLWGDCRPEATGRGFRHDAKAFHGKRSLLLEPGGFFTWFAHDKRGKGAVFSVYAQSDSTGKVELELQNMAMDHHGALAAPVYLSTGDTGAKWTRFSLECPLSGKVTPVDFNIYRVAVRNTGTVPVRIDAAQLEQDVTEPRTFNPVRNSSYRFKINETISLEQYPNLKIAGNNKSGEIPLRVDGLAGAPSPVRGGVPFPAGELFDAAGVELLDKAGNPVPAQFTVLARRPLDGSVISLAVDFRSPDAGPFRLRYGAKPVAMTGKPLARESGDRIDIDTGRLKLTLTPRGDSFLEGSDAFFAVTTPDGEIHRSRAELVRLEENGPERCTVFLRGSAFLGWELRISAFRGEPYLQMESSFENNFTPSDPLYKLVRGIYLQLPGSGKRDDILIRRPVREGAFRIDGEDVPETVSSGSSLYRIAGVADQAPRGFGFVPGGVKLYMWPESGVNVLDVAAGLSGTMRSFYAPDGGRVPTGEPPVLRVEPEWMRRSGVFGDFLTREEIAKEFPRSGAMIDRIFDAGRLHGELTGFRGFGDTGDFGSRNFYRNHETAGVRNLWTRYFSSGDIRDFRLAEQHSIHERDIDQCHIRRGASAVHPHNSWSNLTYNFHTGHYWDTGVVWHYLLTGDRRSLESALSSAAVLVQKSAIQYKGGRERHRMIYHLAELYELSGDPVIRAAFERQYDWGGKSDSDSYYGGIAHEALYKLYTVTGDKKYLDRLREEAAEFRKKNNVDLQAMPEDRSASPTRSGSANEGRAAMMLLSGALVAQLNDDASYLTYLNKGDGDPLLWHLTSPISRDNSVAWTIPYLATMKRFGLRENPAMPERYSDLVRLTGRMQILPDTPFELELTPGKDGKIVLDLYRIRSFRYWQYKRSDDKLAVKIVDGTGKMLAEETIYGNDVSEHRRIALEAPDGKPVTAFVTFLNDCWGGVGSPNPYRIAADRWFGTRSSVFVPLRFAMHAPESGKLAVDWRWRNAKNSRSGEPLAVRLETLEGKVVAHDIYILPAVQPEVKGISTHRTELTIPEEFRNRELVLWMPDLKWIEWKLDSSEKLWFQE